MPTGFHHEQSPSPAHPSAAALSSLADVGHDGARRKLATHPAEGKHIHLPGFPVTGGCG